MKFWADVEVKGPGTVRWRWIRSDGALTPERTTIVQAAGPGTLSTLGEGTWAIGKDFEGWVAVEILSPTPMVSNRVSFSLYCQ